ncbi:polysaccharide deacetylase family protein [Eubacterium ventriosum]|uniref:polysaccharide deacetylase family protein n=1 Tax=Eubacterium ventriosum TaxID=39496 RepID=UPI0033A839B8
MNVTFFMTGGWVESYPDDVKAIKAAGHDLGNHSEHHKHMPQLSNSSICDELNSVTEKVEKLTNTKMCLFRPPYGDYNNASLNRRKIVATTQSNGMLTLLTGKIMALNQL